MSRLGVHPRVGVGSPVGAAAFSTALGLGPGAGPGAGLGRAWGGPGLGIQIHQSPQSVQARSRGPLRFPCCSLLAADMTLSVIKLAPAAPHHAAHADKALKVPRLLSHSFFSAF